MASKITFIIEKDGQELDRAVAEMSDEALSWSINAICDAHNYDESFEVSKERFFSWMIRKWVERQVDRYAAKMAIEAALQQAQAIKDTVVVPDGEQ